MEFASDRAALGPSTAASVSLLASLSACSRDFRGGPRIVKTRCRPVWLTPPWGTVISACQTSLSPGCCTTSPRFSSTSPAGVTLWDFWTGRLCGIFAPSAKEREREWRLDRDFERERVLRDGLFRLESDRRFDREAERLFDAERF